ncbi:MAG: preprotein translocase subunit SecA [Kiritimatiellaceae bacterium]|nr:preprotein translocase subunit SecA [Kiritimatiellaceae bacterium]
MVQNLVRQQQGLCNEVIANVKSGLEQLEKEGFSEERHLELITDLYRVKLGMPKHKQLLRLMEDPKVRKSLDTVDLELNSDFKKNERHALKESLFFILDEKQGQADLTEKGRLLMSPDDPDAFMLPDLPTLFMEIDKRAELSGKEKQKAKQEAEHHFQNTSERIHCISQLLRAYSLYEKDKEYVVQSGKVNIVDQNTGRVMPGRRWSDGLHQAIEAKENCAIEKETKTFASVTIQNYFRMYDKIAGMTGTAETEASEFNEIYGLAVMIIPTNRPNVRKDNNDVIYKTRREKFNAVVKTIAEVNKLGQPVLVGTASVESSELLSRMLKRSNIIHSVLNAKYHAQEAEIVARAGQKGAVTIATNMAGRGTDIKLGEGVEGLGGLYVLGTERHESRRVDRQLRGRCARQGDPGVSKFFVSLEDDLMRLFANAGPISNILEKNFSEDEELEHPMLNWSIENAQKKVEQQNFSIRKRLLQFDDVLNTQREVIYSIRNDAITSDAPRAIVMEMVTEEIEERYQSAMANQSAEDMESFVSWVNAYFPISLSLEQLNEKEGEAESFILESIKKAYDERETFEDIESLKGLERYIVIRAVDRRWQDHLTEMEELRRSVSLRSYGQKDPLSEYKSEAFVFFEELMTTLRSEICTSIFRTATNQSAFEKMFSKMSTKVELTGSDQGQGKAGALAGAVAKEAANSGTGQARPQKEVQLPKVEPIRRETAKIGRNDMVTIRKNGESKQLKYKRAESLIENEGWVLDSNQ